MGRLIQGLDNTPQQAKGGALTIGNFDGVHRGHRELVRHLRHHADQIGGPAIVLTFDPPPSQILRPQQVPPALTWMERRAAILFELGIDFVCVCRTTRDLLELTAEQFFKQILIDTLQIDAIVEGPNFLFGKDRLGDIDLLSGLCQKSHVAISIVSGQSDDGEWISSSRIRTLIQQGAIESANRLLVKPYRLIGVVRRGAARGRKLGFPTANLEEIPVIVPLHGVYAGRAFVDGQLFAAAIHIGPNPTFGEAANKVEVHLLDFEGDLYDQKLEIELLKRLRGITSFPNTGALVTQLKIDIDQSREIAELGVRVGTES